MELAELTAYAEQTYHICEDHKWADFPGFSVLCHPHTKQWVALLMRQWDTDSGTEIERCDIKCGAQTLRELDKPYLSAPLRMHGQKWVGVAFDDETEPEVVFRLFDRAMGSGEQRGYTIVLEPPRTDAAQDTALPFAGGARPAPEPVPERIRQMRRLYKYGRESAQQKAKNFYRQAVFMRDYRDDAQWTGDFVCYFTTYHDLPLRQLRGYFGWRTRARDGEFTPIATSAAYLYVYELLNGVGADTPEDCLKKLKEFETGFLDSGIGDAHMRGNLRRWMMDLAVIHALPPETARAYADEQLMQNDAALAVLRSPAEYPPAEVFDALCRFAEKQRLASPVIGSLGDRGKNLFAAAWQNAAAGYRLQDKDLFTLCFGRPVTRLWYPLANAVWYRKEMPPAGRYVLNACRAYICNGRSWQVEAYETLFFDRARFRGFLHETDLLLRRYLKTGRYLRERPEDAWAAPYIRAAIEADRRAEAEAARPKISIDLSGLDRIRRDAATTRDRLLTEEEIEQRPDDAPEPAAALTETPPPQAPGPSSLLPLDENQLRILRALLSGGDAGALLQTLRMMPSIAADAINEALFEVFGDTVLDCENDRLFVLEDYRDELAQLLGGNA